MIAKVCMASSQVQHVCQLSRTVVDGLVTRVRRIGDLLALVPDSAQLASQRAAVDTLTALRTVRTAPLRPLRRSQPPRLQLLEQAHVAVPLDAAAQTPYSVPQFACNADAPVRLRSASNSLHLTPHCPALRTPRSSPRTALRCTTCVSTALTLRTSFLLN